GRGVGGQGGGAGDGGGVHDGQEVDVVGTFAFRGDYVLLEDARLGRDNRPRHVTPVSRTSTEGSLPRLPRLRPGARPARPREALSVIPQAHAKEKTRPMKTCS